MKTQLFSLLLVATLILSICFERTFGLPLCSLALAFFLLSTLSNRWSWLTFLVGGATLATIYFLPFWLSWLIFLGLWLSIDLLEVQEKHQDLILGSSLFLATILIARQTHYVLWGWQLVYLLIQIVLISLVAFFSGRRHKYESQLSHRQ
jgi:hypothetical protein